MKQPQQTVTAVKPAPKTGMLETLVTRVMEGWETAHSPQQFGSYTCQAPVWHVKDAWLQYHPSQKIQHILVTINDVPAQIWGRVEVQHDYTWRTRQFLRVALTVNAQSRGHNFTERFPLDTRTAVALELGAAPNQLLQELVAYIERGL